MKKPAPLSRSELEAEIQRLKTHSDFKQAKSEIAALRANLAEWLWNQTEAKPAGVK